MLDDEDDELDEELELDDELDELWELDDEDDEDELDEEEEEDELELDELDDSDELEDEELLKEELEDEEIPVSSLFVHTPAFSFLGIQEKELLELEDDELELLIYLLNKSVRAWQIFAVLTMPANM